MVEPCSLWGAMRDAYEQAVRENPRSGKGYAAEIRALVEVKLPEEPPINLGDINMRDITQVSRWIQRDERQRLRLDLLAETTRAEAGG